MTAENSAGPAGDRCRSANRFNEAAADDRGKLEGDRAHAIAALSASMRPRPMTAENPPAVRSARLRGDRLQ